MSIPVLRRLGDHTAQIDLSDGRRLFYAYTKCVALYDPIRGLCVLKLTNDPDRALLVNQWAWRYGKATPRGRAFTELTQEEFEEACDV